MVRQLIIGSIRFLGDNLQVMSHLLREFRGKVDLIYIDPPFDSKADYKKKSILKALKYLMINLLLRKNNIQIFGQMMNIYNLCLSV